MTFNADEILRFAVAIENNGERFYRALLQRLSDTAIRDFFHRMAQDEVAHARLFEGMHARIGELSLREQPEEYEAYLRAYVDHVAFSDRSLEEALASVASSLDAVRLAKRKEQETILFYKEIRDLWPEGEPREPVDQIIEEERRHFMALDALDKKLSGVRPDEPA